MLGNPLRYSDPKGLVKWEGDFTLGSGGLSKGKVQGASGSLATINLTSECVDGERIVVQLGLVGADIDVDVSFDPIPFNGLWGDIELDDRQEALKLDYVTGDYTIKLTGGRFSKSGTVKVWNGTNTPRGEISSAYGYLPGEVELKGKSKTFFSRTEKCQCD